jgi:hypothetical protein
MVYNVAICQKGGIAMEVKTTIFQLCNGKYKNLTELARTMEISVSQIYRVREGKRSINQKFIIGAIKAFPEYTLADLFYLAPEPSTIGSDYRQQHSATYSITESAATISAA